MKSARPAGFDLIRCEAGVVERGLVEEIGDSVRSGAPDQCRDSIDYYSKPILRFLDFVKGVLQRLSCEVLLGYIDVRANQLDNFTIVTDDRASHRMHMPDRTIRKGYSKIDFEVDFRIALPDGSIRHMHSVGRPVVGDDGEVIELIGTDVDVTEQHLAREALQNAFDEIKKSEDRLRVVIDTIPTLVWRAGPDGVPDFLNQPALDYTGLAPDQIETGWPRAFHPDDKKGMLVKWSAIRASGMPGELEARLRRFDGEYRWFLFRGVPLREEGGNIVKWYGSSTDIEDRKRAEEELRRSEAKLIEAQRVSQTGSFFWNISTGERVGSEELFRILGYDQSQQLSFEMILERVHPEDRALVLQARDRAWREGQDVDYEHRF